MGADTSRATQRGGYNREVEWYLTETARLTGERSNFGGLVAVIERGGTGGNSGTKGCGMTRIEPFEFGPELVLVHKDFRRLRQCDGAWARLSAHHQAILHARYCYSRERLPPGLHGQLGDLSEVAVVLLRRRGESELARLLKGAAKKGALAWAEKLAAKELEQAHDMWALMRASTEGMVAIGS